MPPRIFDAFPFNKELEMLTCRLTELEDVPNLVHIIVEATVTHQDRPKPLHFAENAHLFSRWAERIVHVVADRLPTLEEDDDPWARELAQRTYIAKGLEMAEARPDDLVMQSDLDEIPRPLVVRNLRIPERGGVIAFRQRGHFWAVDWDYPPGWCGTTACRVGEVPGFPQMRSLRNIVKNIPNAGWHFSWVGGADEQVALDKVNEFCHPEVYERIRNGIDRGGFFYREGWHVDGVRMKPVEVDRSWPKYIYERRCPDTWWRPR